MVLIIISIILAVITALVLGVTIKKDDDGYKEDIEYKWNIKQLLGLLWLVLILFKCFTTVPANSVGIEYDPLNGGVQKETLKEGFKFKNPLTKVYKITTKVTELNFNNVSVQTSDSQFVNAVIQVQVNIDKEQASTYFAKYGDLKLEEITNTINTSIQKQLESVTIKYNIMELLGEKRNDIVNETQKLAYEELYKDGIILNRLILVDTDAGEAVEKAIQNEAIAKKNVETAKYKKEQAEIEGEAKVIEAKKQKEANDLLSKSLTDEILTEKFIDKWNGELPKVSGSETILDITGIVGK